ncbi:MAG: hypothetical protein DMG93_09190 [Acidobacteria bacterium]|nr:MAG: hypothetical protein DMG93_09190 [Acidobacteriota bacterium]
MNIASMINLYSAKTDEEVLALASQMDQFTVEAQAVLASELTRRRIAVDLEPSKTGEPRLSAERQITKQALSRPKTGEFVEETLRCYHRNRWSFLEVALSAVLLSFLAIQFSRMEVRHLTRHVDLLSEPPSRFLLPEAMLISISGFFVSWMVFCLAFGAICLAVEQEHAGYQISMGGAFEAIFERLGSFMGISALLFGLFFALETFALDRVTLWATPWIESRFGHLSPLTWTLIGAGGYVAVSFIIARLGALAIPALILDDHSITDSLLISYRLTRCEWRILSVLLFKSIVGGYVAAMLPFWVAREIPPTVNLPWWFPWTLSAASIACVSAVEPVMFIGFSLLYLKKTAAANTEGIAYFATTQP